MPVNLNLAAVQPVNGVRLVALSAGLKADNTADMVLVSLAEGSRCAAVFTRNAFCAAPVTVGRDNLQSCDGAVRALLINSGNANAGTGQPGIDMANRHCQAVADALDISAQAVLPFSTGVIGQLLPDERMRSGIARAAQMLKSEDVESSLAWQAAARGIMTTDTQPKATSRQLDIDGQTITISGMSKGAGMIQPDMATMLAYVFTDAAIERDVLQAALSVAVDQSFNAITVDSDTSTNDSCVLIATGKRHSGARPLDQTHMRWNDFMEALTRVFTDLAQAIIRDAEGATKFIRVQVGGGNTTQECKQVGYAIANSPLVKTAMFASDANVGRLLMAIGKAGVKDLDVSRVSVSIGDVLAFEAAGIAAGYTEEKGAAVMVQDEIDIRVDLGRGRISATIYTSDLSHDYVSINADYRS